MKVKIFTVNPFQMNCYLYYSENNKEGVIVDPGFYTKEEKANFEEFLNEKGIILKYVLCTHGHVDHILGNEFIFDKYGLDAYLHKGDLFLYDNFKTQCEFYGLNMKPLPRITNFIDENFKINIGDNLLNFIHTPGHSPGGICIIDHKQKVVFCGDLIFKNSIGRSDLPGGNYETLINSIKEKLFALCSDEYVLYAGHMEKTYVGFEKQNNPYLN